MTSIMIVERRLGKTKLSTYNKANMFCSKTQMWQKKIFVTFNRTKM